MGVADEEVVGVECWYFGGEPSAGLELWLGSAFETWLPSKRMLAIRMPDGERLVRAGSVIRKVDGWFEVDDPPRDNHERLERLADKFDELAHEAIENRAKPEHTHHVPSFPSVPLCVQIGPHNISIVVDEVANLRMQDDLESRLSASYHQGRNEIAVKPDLHRDQEADSVLHEILHAIIRNLGLGSGSSVLADADAEESLVAALSPALLDLLRRNPDLVAYLTA